MTTENIVPPLVKWAGSKRGLLPELLPFFPEVIRGRYIEPFVGAGALFFALRPARAYLSDVNLDLVSAYRATRDALSDLIALLSSYPREREFYTQLRAQDMTGESDLKVGARFLYLVRCGFNGLWRVNSKGQHNVPFGDGAGPVCDVDTLRACSKALQPAKVRHLDFAHMLDDAERGDVVYCDPPYIPLTATASFTGYAAKGFGLEDQHRLRDSAMAARRRGAKVVLSNSGSPVVRELYGKDFRIQEVKVRRSINANADTRGTVKEVIIH